MICIHCTWIRLKPTFSRWFLSIILNRRRSHLSKSSAIGWVSVNLPFIICCSCIWPLLRIIVSIGIFSKWQSQCFKRNLRINIDFLQWVDLFLLWNWRLFFAQFSLTLTIELYCWLFWRFWSFLQVKGIMIDAWRQYLDFLLSPQYIWLLFLLRRFVIDLWVKIKIPCIHYFGI